MPNITQQVYCARCRLNNYNTDNCRWIIKKDEGDNRYCSHCKKKTHHTEECWTKNKGTNNIGAGSFTEKLCSFRNKSNHSSDRCWYKPKQAYVRVETMQDIHDVTHLNDTEGETITNTASQKDRQSTERVSPRFGFPVKLLTRPANNFAINKTDDMLTSNQFIDDKGATWSECIEKIPPVSHDRHGILEY